MAAATLPAMSNLVSLDVTDGIARVCMRRPEARNALSKDLITQLRSTIEALQSRADVRVVILEGDGKSFCAGMDLKAVATDPVAMGDMLRALAETSLAIRKLPMPTIAKVQGAAIGGGCGLMVVCDFGVTHPEAKVGYPEVDLGICPAVVAPWLVKKIGAGPARAMLLLGGTMSGAEGHAKGIASHCVPLDQLETTTMALAAGLAKGGPLAIRETKRWLSVLDGSNDDAAIREAAEISARIIQGGEAQERLAKLWGS